MTETKKKAPYRKENYNEEDLRSLHQQDLRELLKRCYQCARCTGVCQISKVQDFRPSRIIQKILEGFEGKILESGVLWDCLMCNSCMKDCPEDINFADLVRVAKYQMINQYQNNPDQKIAHKGIYTMISEISANYEIQPKRDLRWIPKEIKISESGDLLFHVGCLPYFKFEFDEMDAIPMNSLKMISKIEKDPIVVLEDEFCCGHDLYWGQGKVEEFIELAKKNVDNFERAGVSTIITSCAEGYRTFKIDYPKLFKDFNERFEIKHIIEYLYEKWEEGIISFKLKKGLDKKLIFTFHDPCRFSRFLPKQNNIMEKIREIFYQLEKVGHKFNEMKHNKANSLCCGVSSWMNCNERSKALRYKRLLEAKEVSNIMVSTCPKCELHFKCLQNDFEDISSIKILDFTEFIINFIQINQEKIKDRK
ncbi:MAG: CoB--CoM heterodisulfide reductase iron-sulfur subunit D [Promethearchaeota archaeon]|nr:MAG: CoB--CoM heterodisulfide reductase iron-sulfur subunit D [Candidatus Lokiarchaeota archaeon]